MNWKAVIAELDRRVDKTTRDVETVTMRNDVMTIMLVLGAVLHALARSLEAGLSNDR